MTQRNVRTRGVRNIGTALLLTVLRLNAAATSTVGTLDTRTVYPGQTVLLDVSLDSGLQNLRAAQLWLTFDPPGRLVVTSLVWNAAQSSAFPLHAHAVQSGPTAPVRLAAVADGGALAHGRFWSVGVHVPQDAAGGTVAIRAFGRSTLLASSSFADDDAGAEFEVAEGNVTIADIRPSQLVATGVSTSAVHLAWTAAPSFATGFAVERMVSFGAQPATSIVDNAQAQLQGAWTLSTSTRPFYGTNYIHDGNAGQGTKWARFRGGLGAGRYALATWYPALDNRASNVPVVIETAQGPVTVLLNERINGSQWFVLGTNDLTAACEVRFETAGANGYVIADAVRFIRTETTEWQRVATLAEGTDLWTDTGLTAGRTYLYRVRTLTASSDGPVSAEASATTLTNAAPVYAVAVLHGTASVGQAAAGAQVRITADPPPAGQCFARWTGGAVYVDDPAAPTATVLMPAAAVALEATYASSDADGDGMDDAWESAQFCSTNAPLGAALGDADGDGTPNRDEFVAGTAPLDAASQLRIEELAASPGRIGLQWQSAPSRNYHIEWAPTPTGTWETVGERQPSTSPRNTVELDTTATHDTGFFRILLAPP